MFRPGSEHMATLKTIVHKLRAEAGSWILRLPHDELFCAFLNVRQAQEQKNVVKMSARAQEDPSLQETVPWDIMQGPARHAILN